MQFPAIYEVRGVPTNLIPAVFLSAVNIAVNPPQYYKRVSGVWVLRKTGIK